jgi:hypothetical protein
MVSPGPSGRAHRYPGVMAAGQRATGTRGNMRHEHFGPGGMHRGMMEQPDMMGHRGMIGMDGASQKLMPTLTFPAATRALILARIPKGLLILRDFFCAFSSFWQDRLAARTTAFTVDAPNGGRGD